MSLKGLFHRAICDMVALNAHGALEYCLCEGQWMDLLAHYDEVPRMYFICVLDKDGVFLRANDKLLERIGLPRSELIGSTIHDSFPRHVADRRIAMVKKCIMEGRTICFLDRRANNCFETTIVPLRSQSGTLDRALCMARSVAILRSAEDKLYEPDDKGYVWERIEPVG